MKSLSNGSQAEGSSINEAELLARVKLDEALRGGAASSFADATNQDLVKTIKLLQDTLGAASAATHIGDLTQQLNREPWSLPNPFGRFEVMGELGSGAFGKVFKARDPQLKRLVAIKVLHPDLRSVPNLSKRFVQEAEAAARLNHPSIVRIHEAGAIDGVSYIAAEYIEGTKLQIADFKGCDVMEVAGIVAQLADAIHHSHQHGVLHRDIKPDNILLESHRNTDGSQTTVARLTDFGLARIQAHSSDFSGVGLMVGTMTYMSPEQLLASGGEIGPTSDIYALGVVLYELLTGQRLRGMDKTVHQTLTASREYPSTRSVRGEIPKDLDAICMRCLAFDRKDRFQTASELHAELLRFLDGRPTQTRPLSSFEHLVRWAKRRRSAAAAAGVACLCAMVTLAVILVSTYRLAHQNRELKDARTIVNQAKLQAESHEARFRALSWKFGLQNAFSQFERGRLFATKKALADLAESHIDADHRPEWLMLNSELKNSFTTLANLAYPIREVALVPGPSPQIAIVGDSPEIIIFDLKTRQMTQKLTAGIKEIHALTVSHDGRYIAVGGSVSDINDEASPILIDLATGNATSLAVKGPTTIESLSLSADDRQLAIGYRYEGATIVRLDLASGKIDPTPLTTVTGRRRNRSIGWLESTGDAIVHSDYAELSFIDDAGRRRVVTSDAPFEVFATIPDTKSVVVSNDIETQLSILDAERNIKLADLQCRQRAVKCLSVSADGKWIAAAGTNGEVFVWMIDSETFQPGGENQPFSIAFVVDSSATALCWINDMLIVAGEDGSIVQWLPSAHEYSISTRNPVTAATYTGRNSLLLGFNDGSLMEIDSKDFLALEISSFQNLPPPHGRQILTPNQTPIHSLSSSRSGRLIVVGYANGRVDLLHADGRSETLQTGTEEIDMQSVISDCAVSDDDRWVAWGGAANQLCVYDVLEGTLKNGVSLTSDIDTVEFVDGSSIAVGGQFESARVFSVDGESQIHKFGDGAIHALTFDPITQTIIAGCRDGVVRSYSSSDETLLKTLRVDSDSIQRLAATNDLNLAITISDESEVHIANVRDDFHYGRLRQNHRLRELSTHSRVFSEFSPDGESAFVLLNFLADDKCTSVFRHYTLGTQSSEFIVSEDKSD